MSVEGVIPMVTVLLLVLVVLLVAAVVGLILYVRDLRTERRAARSEVRDLTDQVDRRAKKAVDSSRAVHVAKVTEMFAPLLPQFPAYNVKDVQWVGGTIDIIVFDGLEDATQNHFPPGAQVEIIFVDVKTGKGRVEPRQRLIRDAVNAGRVRFEVFRPRPEDLAAALTVSDEGDALVGAELKGELAIGGDALDSSLAIDHDSSESEPIMVPVPDE
jgi:predicted Holliday junction resolvase-like endonuclease